MRKFAKKFVGVLIVLTIIGVIMTLTMLSIYLSNGNMLTQISLSILFAIILANIAFEIYTLYNKRIEKRSQAKMTYKCSLNGFIENNYKAEKVRKLVLDKTNYNYRRILSMIKIGAKEGKYLIEIKYNDEFYGYEPCMKEPLEELGYTVTEKDNKVIISWY